MYNLLPHQLVVFRVLFPQWSEFCEFRLNLAEDRVLPTIERRRKHARARERRKQQELEEKQARVGFCVTMVTKKLVCNNCLIFVTKYMSVFVMYYNGYLLCDICFMFVCVCEMYKLNDVNIYTFRK